MKLIYEPVKRAPIYDGVTAEQWGRWTWQMQQALSSEVEFAEVLSLSVEEKGGFQVSRNQFKISSTPYYMSLVREVSALRRIVVPLETEGAKGAQSMLDPLAEVTHGAAGGKHLIHRYSDRVLFLVTDICSVYCRFCTRKRFTGHDQGFVGSKEYQESLEYIRSRSGIREVILSGGDPLTLSNSVLARVLSDVRAIEHVEIIRVGSRMPVVCPMRIDEDLADILKKNGPVYFMNHFNHPKELTAEAALSLKILADHGIPLLNQMVLLNGVNNHAAIVQALSRRLLFLRVKPYYMFQCDPSEGTDHLRTTVENSEAIARELWGHLSGLAMPTLSLDIPNGAGKTTLAPNFMVSASDGVREFVGWDGRPGRYVNPRTEIQVPDDVGEYLQEWEGLKQARRTRVQNQAGQHEREEHNFQK